MVGGSWAEKLAFALPGVPAGLSRFSASGEAAQLETSSPLASGLIRSSDAEYPSAPVGHGGLSLYLTVSAILPEASVSSIRSPLWLSSELNTPATGAL